MIVTDAGATVAYLIDRPEGAGEVVRQWFTAEELHAPHLIELEVVNALRRLALSGAITSSRAREALEDFVDLRIVLYPHAPLLARVWELRQNLTAYDAVYVALAQALGIALLTTDSGIRDAPGHHALVELVQSR